MAVCFYTCPVGEIGIEANEEAITHLYIKNDICLPDDKVYLTPIIKEAKAQVDAYFAGELREFDLPLAPSGTEYMKKIWRLLCEIPYGGNPHLWTNCGTGRQSESGPGCGASQSQ